MRNWKFWAAAALALVVGVGIGAAGAETTEVVREVEVPVEVPVEVEVVREVEVPVEVDSGRLDECYAYIAWLLDGMNHLNEITLGGLEEMAVILDRDGYMVGFEFVDIVERMTDQMVEAADGFADQRTFDCLEGPVS